MRAPHHIRIVTQEPTFRGLHRPLKATRIVEPGWTKAQPVVACWWTSSERR